MICMVGEAPDVGAWMAACKRAGHWAFRENGRLAGQKEILHVEPSWEKETSHWASWEQAMQTAFGPSFQLGFGVAHKLTKKVRTGF